MRKKLTSTALAVALAVGMCPSAALAAEGTLTAGSAELLSVQDDAAEYTHSFTLSEGQVVVDGGDAITGKYASSDGTYEVTKKMKVAILKGGTYYFSGTYSNANGHAVSVETTEDVTLVFGDLTVSSSGGAALQCKKGSNVTLQVNGTATLVDAENPANENSEDADVADAFEGAAVKVKSGASLTITGSGTLNIDGSACKNGIKGASEAQVIIGESSADTFILNVAAANNGIASDGSVVVNGGTVNVEADNDGVKASPDADDTTSEGTIAVNGGILNITAGDKGFNANTGDPTTATVDGVETTVANTTAESTIDITGGIVTVNSAGDAIHASGDITVSAGTFNLTSTEGDGIHSKTNVVVSGGTFNILTKGGYLTNHDTVDSLTDGDGTSYKGIKASADDEDADAVENTVLITGGSFRLNTLDDAVHSDDYATITGGTLRIWTGDDGVHADTSLTLGSEDSTSTTSPAIFVNSSYEGLEGGSVFIYSGKYRISASDDGINAADGSGTDTFNPGGQPGQGGNFGPGGMRAFSEGETGLDAQVADLDTQATAAANYKLEIHGGDVFVNTGSDGIDSNGTLTLAGGTVVVWGAAAGSDGGPLDCDGAFTVDGATVFAAGSGAMDAHTTTGSSQQCVVSTGGTTMGGGMPGRMQGGFSSGNGTTYSAGQIISVADGDTTVTTPALKNANYVFYSSPTLSSSATLSAMASAEQCTIAFDANGHGAAPASQTVYAGSYVFEPTPPTADGYVFGGWFTDAACTQPFAFGDVVTASQTLYAKWTEATEVASATGSANDEADAKSAETAGALSNGDAAGPASNSGSSSSSNSSTNGGANSDTSPGTASSTASQTGSASNASTALTNEEAAAMFSDVTMSHWVANEGWLAFVVENKLMTGYSGTSLFGPDDAITRGQVITALYRHANPDSTATTTDSASQKNTAGFTDLKDGMYYTEAVNWAKEKGVLTGDASTGYTTVRAEDPVTRQELGCIMYRYATLCGADASGNTAASYAAAPDASSVATWASEAMGWCYAHKVMTGDASTGNLNPGDGATRAHMAKMVAVVVQSL